MTSTVPDPHPARDIIARSINGAPVPSVSSRRRADRLLEALAAEGFRVARQTPIEVAGASVFGVQTPQLGVVWIDD